MDHHQFDEEILDKGTKAILRTRDGKLRAAVPSPLGKCIFLNDVSMEEMYAALKQHKALMKQFPRNGEGVDAFVDSSDTGYTMNGRPVETNGITNGVKKLNMQNGDAHMNGITANGYTDHHGGKTKGISKVATRLSGSKEIDGLINGAQDNDSDIVRHEIRNGQVNGHTSSMNGHANGRL